MATYTSVVGLAVAGLLACGGDDDATPPDARFPDAPLDGGAMCAGDTGPCGPTCCGAGLFCDEAARCCPTATLCSGHCCDTGERCEGGVCVPALSLCTCDAAADPLCGCALEPLLVSQPSAGIPTLAWSGDEFVIVWADTRDGLTSAQLYFASYAEDGSPRAPERQLTDAASTRHSPAVASNGTELAMVWEDYRAGRGEIFFGRMDATGARIGADMQLTDEPGGSRYPAIVAGADSWAVVWWDDRDSAGAPNWEVYFLALELDGTARGPAVRVTNAPPCAACRAVPDIAPALVATPPTGFALAWSDDRDDAGGEIYFAPVTDAGTVGAEARITEEDGVDARPSLAWRGTGFGLAWERDRPSDPESVVFVPLGPDGSSTGEPEAVACGGVSRHLPTVTWAGTTWGVAWHGCAMSPCGYTTYLTQLDAAGTKLSGDVTIDPGLLGGGASTFPAVRWSGSAFGLAWLYDPTPTMNPPLDVEAYFAVVECAAVVDSF